MKMPKLRYKKSSEILSENLEILHQYSSDSEVIIDGAVRVTEEELGKHKAILGVAGTVLGALAIFVVDKAIGIPVKVVELLKVR